MKQLPLSSTSLAAMLRNSGSLSALQSVYYHRLFLRTLGMHGGGCPPPDAVVEQIVVEVTKLLVNPPGVEISDVVCKYVEAAAKAVAIVEHHRIESQA